MKNSEQQIFFTVQYQNRTFKLLVNPDFLAGVEQNTYNPNFNPSDFIENGDSFLIDRKTIKKIGYQSSNPWLMGHNQFNEILRIYTHSQFWEFIILDPTALVAAQKIEQVGVLIEPFRLG